jgi:hypothetical protein
MCPNFVEDFDKALSKYCVFDLFSAIKHIKLNKRNSKKFDNTIYTITTMEFDT